MKAVIVVSICLAGMALIMSGCTSAGPYVTSISTAGRGGIIVEKDTVFFNGFTGTISSGGRPTSQYIKVLESTEFSVTSGLIVRSSF